MANDFTGPTWYVDTPMTVMPQVYASSWIYVNSVNWSNMAAGDVLTIKDRSGRIIFDLTAATANANINLPHMGWQKGLIVTSLGTGNVQIAVGK